MRRATLPRPLKYLAFVVSSYADPDGTRVRPGIPLLAADTGYSTKQVQRLHRQLTEQYGLLFLVKRGGGRGGARKASVYRLSIPPDVFERMDLRPLDPADSPDIQMSPQSEDSEDIQVSGQSDPSPVDNSADTHGSEDIQVSPQSGPLHPNERTYNAVTDPLRGHSDPIERTSRCPPTNHIPTTTDQPTHSPTNATTDRATPAPVDNPAPATPTHPRTTTCRHHLTRCLLCRPNQAPP